jgi:hypothetical protein
MIYKNQRIFIPAPPQQKPALDVLTNEFDSRWFYTRQTATKYTEVDLLNSGLSTKVKSR